MSNFSSVYYGSPKDAADVLDHADPDLGLAMAGASNALRRLAIMQSQIEKLQDQIKNLSQGEPQ